MLKLNSINLDFRASAGMVYRLVSKTNEGFLHEGSTPSSPTNDSESLEAFAQDRLPPRPLNSFALIVDLRRFVPVKPVAQQQP